MKISSARKWVTAALLPALLGACTPAPVLKPAAAPTAVTPTDAAELSEHFAGAEVVWGGELLEVRNRENESEVVILAYPLDGGQRPQRSESSQGRFVAVMPGYIERYDYPSGRFMTIVGMLDGIRDELVGEQHRSYPVVKASASHLWPADFDQRHWHISIGIGATIR